MSLPITFDFETKAIEPRPYYPPPPVGVAIRIPGKKPKYYSFGAPTNNNCTEDQARQALSDVWHHPLLAHNCNFDYAVATEKWGLPQKPWQELHDTIFLLFLDNPHAPNYQLKSCAQRYLDEPPTEQDAVREWLVSHKVCRSNDKDWARFICEAPGDLVGRYAIGDVERTANLYKLLMPKIKKEGMLPAYDRERELAPILLENEQVGLRVDLEALAHDMSHYQGEVVKAERWVRKFLKVKDLNLDANEDLADALDAAGEISQWVYTAPSKTHPKGVRSTAKGNMRPGMFKTPRLASVIGYRNRLTKLLSTFIEPWIEQAKETGGTIHPRWNQTRTPDDMGTRTGRPSVSKPNLLNIAKDLGDKGDGYVHPAFLKLRELPVIRTYLLPDEGHVLLHRDYNQQEVRVAAHFEGDKLIQAYRDNPDMDFHEFTKQEIERVAGVKISRRAAKTLNLGLMYGMGIDKLCASLNVDKETGYRIKDAHKQALPGLIELDRDLKSVGRRGDPIITWGGRVYYVEPPVGQRTFEYKNLNKICQGSAADITKEAILRYYRAKLNGRFWVTVYDEINVSAPVEHAATEMAILREAMESVELDVFLRSDGKRGPSWGHLEECL